MQERQAAYWLGQLPPARQRPEGVTHLDEAVPAPRSRRCAISVARKALMLSEAHPSSSDLEREKSELRSSITYQLQISSAET